MPMDIVALNIREKADSLGFTIPEGLVLLPGNLANALSREELTYESSSATVKKVLVKAGLEVKTLERDGDKVFAETFRKSADWLGPTLFVGSALMTQNPTIITVALNMISTYLTDMFRR